VSGTVKLKLYKGGVAVVGRSSPYSLYDQDLVTFEEGKIAYDQPRCRRLYSAQCAPLRTPPTTQEAQARQVVGFRTPP